MLLATTQKAQSKIIATPRRSEHINHLRKTMPPGLVTPTKRGPKPARFKQEYSPNNRAKCKRCGQKIEKHTMRCGVVHYSKFGASQEYYHWDCLSPEQRQKMPSLEKQEEQERIDNQVAQDPDLRQALSDLRRRLKAQHHYSEACQVLTNATIDQLVIDKPCTLAALLQVKGIGPKKSDKFGRDIVDAIRGYVASQNPIDLQDNNSGQNDDNSVMLVFPTTPPLPAIRTMTNKEIVSEIKSYGLDVKDCFEKEEYVAKLSKARVDRGLVKRRLDVTTAHI